MTTRFLDSFDYYVTADIGKKWTAANSAAISSGNGRRSTSCMRRTTWTGGPSLTLDAQATWIVGFAFRFSALPASARVILALIDTSTTQTDLRINADGTLTVTRNGTSLGSSSNALSVATWYYLELKVTISDAAGVAEVRVDGSSSGWISLSSVDTKATSNASANVISFLNGGVGGTANIDVEDLYINDGQGSTNNNYLGDLRIDAYFPSGNGNSSQLTGSDGNSSDNYLHVDDASQDGDSTYVESGTVGQKDTYGFQDMSHTPASIYAIQINMVSKKDDSGLRSIAAVIRSGGSDTDGSTIPLGTDYTNKMQIRETDPNTSAAWTKSGFNAAEFGEKVAA